MPQALITINATIGSDTDLTIDQIVSLDNVNVGGEVSFLWEILDQPTGVADVLSNATIQNPTFTPKKEGTYLIRLTVNQGLPDEDVDSVVAAVLQLKTRKRVPAAGEQTEASTSRGWAVDVNDELRFFNDQISDPGTVVGANIDASPITRGTVVRATGIQTIKSGLPGQEDVPGFVPAPATAGGNIDELLLVAEGDIDGNTPIPVGGLGVFRWLGRFATLALGSGAVGDSVFVSDTATVSLTPGTNLRQIGSIMAVSGVNRDIWVTGTLGGENAPIDPAYVVFGNPGTLPNANRIDGLFATGATNNIPYTFRAADVTTVALVAKRFSNVGGDPFQVHDETGTVLGRFTASGALIVAPDGTSTTAITGVGAGTGSGVEGSGGNVDGTGVFGTGGSTNGIGIQGAGTGSGTGVLGTGGASNGIGVTGTGAGTAAGVLGTGVGAAGTTPFARTGVFGEGGGASGIGVQGKGASFSAGVNGEGGPTNGDGVRGTGLLTGRGVRGTGSFSGGIGVEGISFGSGSGVTGVSISTGYGVTAIGPATTSGRAALRITPQSGTPDTLDDGAMFIVGSSLFVRLNGVTRTVTVT